MLGLSGALLVAVSLLTKNWGMGVNAGACALCISLPAVSLLASNTTVQGVSRALAKRKAMVNGFAIDKETAGWVVSLIPFGAIVLSPLFGILYDRTGRGTQMMTIGCVVLTVSLLLLNYPLTHALWYVLSMMTLVGIAFSLVPAALWPTVPMMVPLKQLGTAYSIIYYIQNLGLFLVPIWIGKVVDAYTTPSGIDYTIPMLIFIILSIGSMLTAIGLLRITKE